MNLFNTTTVTTTKTSYIGPGSQIINSEIVTATLALATIAIVFWGIHSGVMPRP